ncbi:HlyD family efflux transporter periplasmic adaptor subunit [Parvularcula sp. ZS-1/3]|uniref:HlyD family efflux transporter periplasmic adaptor subunit n=1 Tax=Parvularcula mediterranea TaxID=2732508 RepID=A0A7Y3W673_9PROT|nr:HlyD family efflux transporter periplasmic adaptor subunit [Parvularcula mediterranea]NNU17555.1 HlyD family efflux transporter periplasmic adaptor subunit [Parvularcula mediterranea]
MNRSRLVSLAVVGAVVALFLLWAFWPRPIFVDTAIAQRGTILVTVDEEAEACVREIYEVSAPFSGRLLRVDVEPGDPVIAGETVLARMMPTNPDALDIRTEEQALAAVDAAQAALALGEADKARAEADLALARSTLERYEGLVRVDAASRADHDRAQRDVRFSAAQLRSAEAAISMRTAELRQARALLMSMEAAEEAAMTGNPHPVQSTPVIAAASGVVLQVHRESETTLQAGSPILSVGDPHNDLEVVAELLSPEAVRIEPGDPVLIERWGGDRVLNGRVRRVDPWAFTKISALGIEEQRANVLIELTDPEEGRVGLGHGYRVYVRIVADQRDDVLIVPTTSLFAHEGGDAVYVLREGRAVLTRVTKGLTNGLEAEVAGEGLEGAEVVLYPDPDLQNGDRIRPRGAPS